MSLNKWMAVLHAVITGSVFLPWSNSVIFGYANQHIGDNLQFGFARPAGWVLIAFCIVYYLLDFLNKIFDNRIIQKIKVYFIWSLLFVTGFEAFSIGFLSGKGLFVPQIGLSVAFVASIILVIIFNTKIDDKSDSKKEINKE